MDIVAFEQSISGETPPAGLSLALEALWHERRGDWERAHRIAQEIPDTAGAWVHAYLHRREGDQVNAEYWYRRASRSPARGGLDEEWRAIVEALLDE